MTLTMNLSGKELCAIVAKALQLPQENVNPSRYGVAIKNTPPEEVERAVQSYLEGA